MVSRQATMNKYIGYIYLISLLYVCPFVVEGRAVERTEFVVPIFADSFAIVFPALGIPPNTEIYRDTRSAIEVIEVKCDDSIVKVHIVGPADEHPKLTAVAGDAEVIYACPSNLFLVYSGN